MSVIFKHTGHRVLHGRRPARLILPGDRSQAEADACAECVQVKEGTQAARLWAEGLRAEHLQPERLREEA